MLREFLESLLTPCPPDARRLGYVREAVAIGARHRRCRAAWRPHLEATRAAIADAADMAHRRVTALVLGSGGLLDIPLEALSTMFGRVVLADIVHPLGARLKVRAFPNVSMDTVDLGGAVARTAAWARAGKSSSTGEPCPDTPRMDRYLDLKPDLVVSANILSQLPLLPARALAASGRCPPERVEALSVGLIREHVAWLGRFGGVRLLVTDTAWHDGGQAVDPLREVALPAPWRTWRWDVAPRPEVHADRDIVHEVAAFLL